MVTSYPRTEVSHIVAKPELPFRTMFSTSFLVDIESRQSRNYHLLTQIPNTRIFANKGHLTNNGMADVVLLVEYGTPALDTTRASGS